MSAADVPHNPPPAIAAPELIEERTDHGEHRRRGPLDDLFNFEVPQPPEVDASTGQRTSNYGYELKLAIWRDRITRGLAAVHGEQIRYAEAEDVRHKQLLVAIRGQGSFTRYVFECLKALGAGTLEITRTIAGNEQGQLKYFALTLLGLAAIVNGIAFSGFGFSAESSIKCGRGTVEDHGRCIPAAEPSASDLEASPAP